LINILHFKNIKYILFLFSLIIITCSDSEDEMIESEKEIESKLVPFGYNKFVYNKYAPLADKPIDVHTYLPDSLKKDIPVLFVMHGNSRDARGYCFAWVESARKLNFLVVCPELDIVQFPKSDDYHLGGIFNDNELVDSTKWSFNFIEAIFSYLIKEGVTTVNTYGLYGHSAGSQYVHRLALYTEPKNASIIIAANAGWYTTIDFNEDFPYGLKNSPIKEETLTEKFTYPIVILLGENDINPNASSLRKTEKAMLQGIHRFERGTYFYETARNKANQLNTSFNWRLQTVPSVGHSNNNMAPTAAEIFISSINN